MSPICTGVACTSAGRCCAAGPGAATSSTTRRATRGRAGGVRPLRVTPARRNSAGGSFAGVSSKHSRKETFMWGAVIGDVVGSRSEGSNGGTKDFELFHHRCRYTDDTVCTAALAHVVVNDRRPDTTLQQWCRRHPGRGYGGGVRALDRKRPTSAVRELRERRGDPRGRGPPGAGHLSQRPPVSGTADKSRACSLRAA